MGVFQGGFSENCIFDLELISEATPLNKDIWVIFQEHNEDNLVEKAAVVPEWWV